MTRRLVICCTSLFFTSVVTLSQSLNMSRWLNTGNEKERTRKLVALGVEEEQARLAASDTVEWRPIKGESDRKLAILFTPCGTFDASNLYLLESGSAGWHVTDTVGFDCHYDESLSVETASVRYPNIDDVLVHHECEERGTGYVEQHFNVFAVDSGKFRIVLNTKEVVKESRWPQKYEFRLTSTFALLAPEESAARILQETQCVNENGEISIQKRRFSWNESAFRLVPADFVKVQTPRRSIEASCR